jgi:hypothetical protein
VSVRYMFSRSSRCISSFVYLTRVSRKITSLVETCLLNEIIHDCLGHHVNQRLLDDVVV